MRVLLSILSSLTIAASGTVPLVNTAHQFSETNNNKEYDHGKGVWIGYMWGIPNLGWGSNK